MSYISRWYDLDQPITQAIVSENVLNAVTTNYHTLFFRYNTGMYLFSTEAPHTLDGEIVVRCALPALKYFTTETGTHFYNRIVAAITNHSTSHTPMKSIQTVGELRKALALFSDDATILVGTSLTRAVGIKLVEVDDNKDVGQFVCLVVE